MVYASTQGGNDVVTQVANKRIHWGTYKIDPKRDRIGVFVSIVSTKVGHSAICTGLMILRNTASMRQDLM